MGFFDKVRNIEIKTEDLGDKASENIQLNTMTDFDEIIGGNTQEHNPHWPQILNHSYRILIVDNFGSFKTNVLISIINHQPEIHKIFLHAKDPYALKYQYLKKKICE